MIELKEKPLKRGIPCSRFYVELYFDRFVVKVRGSKREGVTINWITNLAQRQPPPSAPAKLKDAFQYLQWVADKAERRKEKAHDRRTVDDNS